MMEVLWSMSVILVSHFFFFPFTNSCLLSNQEKRNVLRFEVVNISRRSIVSNFLSTRVPMICSRITDAANRNKSQLICNFTSIMSTELTQWIEGTFRIEEANFTISTNFDTKFVPLVNVRSKTFKAKILKSFYFLDLRHFIALLVSRMGFYRPKTKPLDVAIFLLPAKHFEIFLRW